MFVYIWKVFVSSELTIYNFVFCRLSDLPYFETDSKVQFVIDAVYAFAHALNKLKEDVCPYWKGVCPAMTYYDGGDFYKNYLLNVNFKGKIFLIFIIKTKTLIGSNGCYLLSNTFLEWPHLWRFFFLFLYFHAVNKICYNLISYLLKDLNQNTYLMNRAQKHDFKNSKAVSKDFLDLYILSWRVLSNSTISTWKLFAPPLLSIMEANSTKSRSLLTVHFNKITDHGVL